MPHKRKDETVYRGRFARLHLQAFGIDQLIAGTFDIEVYYITCRPPRWRARPFMARAEHRWEGPSAEHVMHLVESDFELCLIEWRDVETSRPAPRLSPAPPADTSDKKSA